MAPTPGPEARGRTLIISPHPDDEVIGAGGLIAKLSSEGSQVWVIFAVVDAFRHYGLSKATTLQDRKAEIEEVSDILGYRHETLYEGMNLMEKLDTVPLREMVDKLEDSYNRIRPDLLVLPHGDDFDQDHVRCFRAAFAAARPLPQKLGKFFPKRVLTYESPKLVWSSKSFHPTFYVDITDRMDAKIEALQAYRSQLRSPPDVRSPENLRALAYLRGSEVGYEYAEGYSVLRWIL